MVRRRCTLRNGRLIAVFLRCMGSVWVIAWIDNTV
jgi:hypothetical protein